jgi:hypothetical protein
MAGERYLSGTYNSGYTLSASFSVLNVTTAGVVNGTIAGGYAAGGEAVSIGFVAELLNHGSLTGGAGGGGFSVSGKSVAGPGYSGGAGADLTSGGTVANYAAINGGSGGQGGAGFGGGAGGGGGYGVRVGGPGTVTNAGHVTGGQGGFGGPGTHPGHGGTGGTGVVLTGAGSVGNTGTVVGGAGGGGEGDKYSAGAGGTGGTALALKALATAVNSGLLQGGGGGAGGTSTDGLGAVGGAGGSGVYLAVGATFTNSGTVQGGIGGTGGNTGKAGYYNYTSYYYFGGAGGAGGAGCWLGAGGTVINTGEIAGGEGGKYGSGSKVGYQGSYGVYGDGVYLPKGGVVTNGSTAATFARIYGYAGVRAAGKATVTNFGTIGSYFQGVVLDAGGVVTNGSKTSTTASIYGVSISGVGALTNFGTIDGYGVGATGAVRVVNFGDIGGSGGTAVFFSSASARLVAETGSVFGGISNGGGGALELVGGADTIAGMGGLGTVTGGLSLGFELFGTYQFDAEVSATLIGANALTAGAKLIDTGALSLAAGASLNVGDGALAEIEGAVANAGSIDLSGKTSATHLRILAPGASLTGGGTIVLGGPKNRIVGATAATLLVNVDNTLSGAGSIGAAKLTLKNAAAGVIDATGAGDLKIATTGETLVNGGLMEASGGGLLIIDTTTVNNIGGTILAATGARVEMEDVVVIGGSVASAGTGTVSINVSGGEFNGGGHTVTLSGQVRLLNAKSLTLNGAIANTGKLQLFASTATTNLMIGAAGVTLSGKGTVSLSNSADNRIFGMALSDTLTNVDNLIEGAGQLGNGKMKLVNEAGGQIIGNQTVALTINTVSNTITNAGLIENRGAGGTLVESAVVNTGTLMAAVTGTLALTGAVTGVGIGIIDGGTLDVTQAFSGNVTFKGTSGVFELGDSAAYKGKITGLSPVGNNSLDLADITFTSGVTKAHYSGTSTSGTLTVTDGTHTARITLMGDYVGHTFSVASDGHGGTTVIDPPAPTTLPVVQAIAGFGTGPPPAAIISFGARVSPPPTLYALT